MIAIVVVVVVVVSLPGMRLRSVIVMIVVIVHLLGMRLGSVIIMVVVIVIGVCPGAVIVLVVVVTVIRMAVVFRQIEKRVKILGCIDRDGVSDTAGGFGCPEHRIRVRQQGSGLAEACRLCIVLGGVFEADDIAQGGSHGDGERTILQNDAKVDVAVDVLSDGRAIRRDE